MNNRCGPSEPLINFSCFDMFLVYVAVKIEWFSVRDVDCVKCSFNYSSRYMLSLFQDLKESAQKFS
jgi:hypothetical protein